LECSESDYLWDNHLLERIKNMLLVTTIIKPHKFEDVKGALIKSGVAGMTISEVKGFGRQKGHTETYRGSEYEVDVLPKIKIEILSSDEYVESIIETIQASANTEKIGDGKIYVQKIEECIRIRTGEKGKEAI
tara:strand:+ start:28839 stop:29237 length:399 start_codon:yes stop_codon:yes gene_type:complete